MNDGEFVNYYIAKIIDFRDERERNYALQAKLENLILSLNKLYEGPFHGCGWLYY